MAEALEVTPAVRRAEDALARAIADDLYAESCTGDSYDVLTKYASETWRGLAERIGAMAAENTRPALVAALDAGEMHRVIVDHRIRKTEEVYDDTIVTCLCEAECSGYDGWRYHQATALRTAILGSAS